MVALLLVFMTHIFITYLCSSVDLSLSLSVSPTPSPPCTYPLLPASIFIMKRITIRFISVFHIIAMHKVYVLRFDATAAVVVVVIVRAKICKARFAHRTAHINVVNIWCSFYICAKFMCHINWGQILFYSITSWCVLIFFFFFPFSSVCQQHINYKSEMRRTVTVAV